VPQFAQGHLLGDQLSGAGLDLLALGGAQLTDDVIYIRRHDFYPFSFFKGLYQRSCHQPQSSR